MNSTRLGSYSLLKRITHGGDPALQTGAKKDNEFVFFMKNVFCGATAGMLGATVGSPFFLVKVRMQNQTKVAANAVGKQYNYTGTFKLRSSC